MPNITLNTFVDGAVVDGGDVADNLYEPQDAAPATDATSFEVMNGWLDERNKDVGWTIKTEHIQPHALTNGRMVGGTVNNDYFEDDFFNGFAAYTGTDFTGVEGSALEYPAFVPIPGGCTTCFVPYKALLIFTWNICWTGDGTFIGTLGGNLNDAREERSIIRFYLHTPTVPDGAPPETGMVGDTADELCRRRVGTTVGTFTSGTPTTTEEIRFDFSRHREYSGHYMVGVVDRGWYGGSLRIATSAPQARVHVRGMKYIYFKSESTLPY
tara:strand:- start:535 stop:1341 length:807 start_codon:yes stop_codon:yes gene_type:complete